MNIVEEQVRELILPRKLRSIDGIWSHRVPLPRKPTATTPSGALRMSKSLAYDALLAAASVIPAVIVLIATEKTIIGLGLGAAIFLSIEYVIPAYRAGKLDSTIEAAIKMYWDVYKFVRAETEQRSGQKRPRRA